MLLLKLNKTDKEPLFKQVLYQIKDMIETGAIKEGERLPSSRELANNHGINRTTVYKAYEELWSIGYIRSKSGSYSIARKPSITSNINQTDIKSPPHFWDSRVNTELKKLNEELRICKTDVPDSSINFRVIAPDKRFMPVDDFRKCMNEVLISDSDCLLDYGDPQGYFPLRKYLSQNMQKHGISASPEEIIITNGAQDGLNLFLRLFGSKAIKIIVEEPCYEWALRLFRASNVKVFPVPMTQDGMDLVMLQEVLRNETISFIYTIPNFHNPTGISTDQVHREEILKLAEEFEVPIIEDGFEEEMKYFTKAVLPIKSMDKTNLVVYLGTFSKVLFPGLRIGWIVSDKKCIEYLTNLKNVSDFSGNILSQAALLNFCQKGFYERHLKRLHKNYKRRMQAMFKATNEYLKKDSISLFRPIGGYTLWLTLKHPNRSEDDYIDAFQKAGVLVAPGKLYFLGEPAEVHFRISIARTSEEEILEGVKRISEILKQ